MRQHTPRPRYGSHIQVRVDGSRHAIQNMKRLNRCFAELYSSLPKKTRGHHQMIGSQNKRQPVANRLQTATLLQENGVDKVETGQFDNALTMGGFWQRKDINNVYPEAGV